MQISGDFFAAVLVLILKNWCVLYQVATSPSSSGQQSLAFSVLCGCRGLLVLHHSVCLLKHSKKLIYTDNTDPVANCCELGNEPLVQ
jgi:hypothetical protein